MILMHFFGKLVENYNHMLTLNDSKELTGKFYDTKKLVIIITKLGKEFVFKDMEKTETIIDDQLDVLIKIEAATPKFRCQVAKVFGLCFEQILIISHFRCIRRNL